MKKFASNETEKLYFNWLKSFPESYNSFDIERFHNFVYSLLKNGDYLTEIELKESFKEIKGYIPNEFVEDAISEIHILRQFYDYLKENKLITSSDK
jgi:hypothetical protein